MSLPELTIVVTTFRRPERFRKCLQSIVDAGGRDCVVASSGGVKKEAAICEEFSSRLNITTSLLEVDNGCNETWLRGVTLAPTKHVLILHDDDWLLPEFGSVYRREIYPQLVRGVGFATWRGKVVSDINEIDADVGCLRGETRVCGTANVTKAIMNFGVTSPSPVISVFRRDICIRTLREAENALTDRQYFTRPKMMVGNDLLLYLRHAEAFDSWLFLDKILTCYGGHDGSETARHQSPKGLKKLLTVYNHVRGYYARTRQQPVFPKIFHVWTDYTPRDQPSKRRQKFARSTWQNFLYSYGDAYPVPYPDGAGRTSKDVVGDCRPLPFLRDMIDYAASLALAEDVVMLSNDDIAFTPDALDKLRHIFFVEHANALFSWRHNFHHRLTHPLKDLRTGHKDGGVDLLAFRPATWRAYREKFPDFILGCEAWDYCYRVLIPELPGGREIDGIIYHEFHDPVWRKATIRTANPGQRYNRHLARNFFRRRVESDSEIPKFKDNE